MTAQTIASRKSTWWMEPRILRFLESALNNSLLVTTVILIVVFSIIGYERNFLTFENLVNILISGTVLGFTTWGLAVTMLAGNIDFSTPGISAIASITLGVMFMQRGLGAVPSILVTAIMCAVFGLLTSVLIVNFKIPGLVATIAVNGSFTAFAMFLCNNYQINIRRPELEALFFSFRPFGIPFSVWIMFIFFGIAWLVLNHTRLGAHIYATGANPQAARLSGIRIGWIVRMTLMWCAICVAMAGIIQTSRSGITILYGSSGGLQPNLTPVVLGGIALFGGSGKIENMFIAIIFTTVLYNGLFLMSASTGVIQMTNGLVFLIAIMMSAARDWFARIQV